MEKLEELPLCYYNGCNGGGELLPILMEIVFVAGASGVLKEESLFSMSMSEPIPAAASLPLTAGPPGDLLMPTPAMPHVPDTGRSKSKKY